jgi:GT2 family glycosyltransferase
VVHYDAPFNFSAINNLAVKHAAGEVVCFLNNDIEVISGDWLHEMVSHALRPGVGAVGAKLLYPATFAIQHAGVVLGLCGGIAAHPFRGAGKDDDVDWGRPQAAQRYCAVTAACLVMLKKRFEEVGGFDEELPIAYNDVDLCLRLTDRGYHSIYTPHAELVHHESATRGPDTSPEKRARLLRDQAWMRQRWGARLANDPYYNPNLTLDAEDLGLAYPPRVELPWRSVSVGRPDESRPQNEQRSR